ncbi:diguanylate cyclase [bacterium]|nr:diguanylate cyclase [bacterium]MBU1989180.1 diguanylate cyclase [bacterium]
MFAYRSIKNIFILNYIVLFSGIAFSFYYAHQFFIDLKEKSAYKNLLAINTLNARSVDAQLRNVSKSVEALGNSYAKIYSSQYEHLNSEPIYLHNIEKDEQITFYQDCKEDNEYEFKSDHPSMILSNLKQDEKIIAHELNIFHQLVPALESIHNSFDFSWVYFTTVNDFILVYPYVPFQNAHAIYQPTKQHFYKAANFADKRVGWEEPYYDLAGDGVLVSASYPVFDNNDTLLGVASHDISVDKIAESILSTTTTYEGSVTFLMSKHGKVIASSDKEYMKELKENDKNGYRGNFHYRTQTDAKSNGMHKITISNHDYLNQLGDEITSENKKVDTLVSKLWNSSVPYFNDKMIIVSQIPTNGWILVSYVPKEIILGETKSILYKTYIILSLFITLLFMISAFFTMRHLITPLEIINAAAEKVGGGFTNVHVSYSNYNLLHKLYETFNTMTIKISYHHQLLEKKVDERTKELQEEIVLRKKIEDTLRLISRTDVLTGIWNRRYFFEQFEREVYRSHRYKINMVLLMIDIDFFKKVNDTWGHNVGDEALKHISKIISSSIRKENIFGRLGGEEFGVILIETKETDTSLSIAERIRKNVDENPLILDENAIHLSISIGISRLRETDNVNELYIRCDKALYAAKENGRNRIEEI